MRDKVKKGSPKLVTSHSHGYLMWVVYVLLLLDTNTLRRAASVLRDRAKKEDLGSQGR